MTRSAGWISRYCRLAVTIPVIAVWLAACQQAEPPSIVGPPSGWQMIERVGDVRVTHATEPDGQGPRTGDMVAAGSRIATGRAGRIILKKNGVQLTVGVGASLVLPTEEPASDLVQEAGWIRYRMSTPVNAAFGVTTPSLGLHASSTVVDVRVGDGTTRVAVDSGQVDISTRGGHHHARLAAGASARADDQAGGRLMVKTSTDRDFRPIAPLASATPKRPGSLVRATSSAARPTADTTRSDMRVASNPSLATSRRPARRHEQKTITLAARAEPRPSALPASPVILAATRPHAPRRPAGCGRLGACRRSGGWTVDGQNLNRSGFQADRPLSLGDAEAAWFAGPGDILCRAPDGRHDTVRHARRVQSVAGDQPATGKETRTENHHPRRQSRAAAICPPRLSGYLGGNPPTRPGQAAAGPCQDRY